MFELLTFVLAALLLFMILRNSYLRDDLSSAYTYNLALQGKCSGLQKTNRELLDQHEAQQQQLQESRQNLQDTLERLARRDQQIANQRDAIRQYHDEVAELREQLDQTLEFYGAVEDLVKAKTPRPVQI